MSYPMSRVALGLSYASPCRRLKVQCFPLCLQLTQGLAGASRMHRTFRNRQRSQARGTRFLVALTGCGCIVARFESFGEK